MPLRNVARWLRTDALEAAALKADIYNISYIDPAKITPELAERAVRPSCAHAPCRLRR